MDTNDRISKAPDVETASDDYAQRFAGGVGEWFLEVQEEATCRMLDSYPGARILDVGGGHGQTTPALIESGYDLTVLGSDAYCGRRIQPYVEKGLCKFDVGNVVDLPFAARAFDVVISYRMLPHVVHWKRYLGELARVAREAVIIDYPDVRSVNYVAPYLYRFKKQLEGNTRPFVCFKMSDILEAFEKSGFVYSDHYRQFLAPMVIHRKLGHPKTSKIIEKGFRALGLTDIFGSPVILKATRT